MTRYNKAIAAAVAGVAEAAVLLPTDAPRWLLAAVVVLQPLAVAVAPKNQQAV
jgi:hypothetical protein